MNAYDVARISGLCVAVVVSGCSAKAGAKNQAEAGRPAVAVETSAAGTADLVDAIEVVGTLEPKNAADVKSESTAIIAEVFVTEWVKVAKGAPLARLDTREAETSLRAARAAVLQAEVGERRAERELERTRKLKEYGLATQQHLDDATSARDAAVATVEAARAQLSAAQTQLDKAVIRAPMAGYVAYRGVSVGDRVESMGGGTMFRVVDLSTLQLAATVPSSRSEALAVGQPLEFAVDSLPGRTFTGRVEYINPSLEAGSRAVQVQVDVPNPTGELRGGVFAKGRIRTGERKGVLQIPRAALLSWDAVAGVGQLFVVDGETARRREVRTGSVSGDAIEVKSGVSVGDQVVTRGAFTLRDGDRIVASKPQGA